ncbi:MAG: class I fructose-bisphosphate aldolase [Candidatus Nanoarchaeia archaeon]
MGLFGYSFHNQKEIDKIITTKLSTNNKALYLAQDQGLEHGVYEFDETSINPEHVFSVAEKGEVDGFICQKGLAEKYANSYKTNLILKVNGKTAMRKHDDPYSPLTCSVKRAVELGASAIGFTNFVGSKHEAKIFEDFRYVQEEAHEYGLPVTSWMYPRGEAVENDTDAQTLQYSARVGLELGADMLKMKYNGNPEDMKAQIRCGGRARMLMAGGNKTNTTQEFLDQVKEVDNCGVFGFAIGRNIWQHKEPIEMTKALRDIQIRGMSTQDAMKRFSSEQPSTPSQENMEQAESSFNNEPPRPPQN